MAQESPLDGNGLPRNMTLGIQMLQDAIAGSTGKLGSPHENSSGQITQRFDVGRSDDAVQQPAQAQTGIIGISRRYDPVHFRRRARRNIVGIKIGL